MLRSWTDCAFLRRDCYKTVVIPNRISILFWRMGKDKDKTKEKGGAAVAAGGSSSAVDRTDFAIAPSSSTPPLDTSKWPLLLKNYDKVF